MRNYFLSGFEKTFLGGMHKKKTSQIMFLAHWAIFIVEA
jgi:hypothetical protein